MKTSSASTIPLGFTISSGDPVTIPLAHMAVTGQTQAAGKTTALEACASRVPADYTVLAFTTKRGEGGFAQDTVACPPHFRERADWEYVQAILEATLRERMKFERGWIMRASKGAATLADVHRNVKTLMVTAKGLSADIYYQLDNYLDKVVPQVRSLGPSRSLSLARSHVNVMDLTPFSLEMQGLIIASCLDTVYANFKDTIVVIPEAWEFLPRQRRSPVTVAAETFVRKGTALKNFLWIDSQDLSGVHTPVLKQVGVWLLGVQREINEARRTVAHVHAAKKPKVADVAGLGLGQFIACFGAQAVKTYVQPVWMNATKAAYIARGEIPVDLGRSFMPDEPQRSGTFTGFTPAEEIDPMDTRLKAENAELKQQNQHYAKVIADLQREVAALSAQVKREQLPDLQEQADRIVSGLPLRKVNSDQTAADISTSLIGIWPAVRAQILSDPQILAHIAATRPEIIVEIEPKRVAFDYGTPRGRLARMIAKGIMDQPIKPGVLLAEFKRTGSEVHPSRLSEYLMDFVQLGLVTREDGGVYVKVPAVKVTEKELAVV